MDGMIECANSLAAGELAKRYWQKIREQEREINRLRALLQPSTADIEITQGRCFRLIEPEG
jgi:hypothetical protein